MSRDAMHYCGGFAVTPGHNITQNGVGAKLHHGKIFRVSVLNFTLSVTQCDTSHPHNNESIMHKFSHHYAL
jgi:hypothetical protein